MKRKGGSKCYIYFMARNIKKIKQKEFLYNLQKSNNIHSYFLKPEKY